MNRTLAASLLAVVIIAAVVYQLVSKDERVLVFSMTQGYRHDSIEDGKRAIMSLGLEHGFEVDSTENPAIFTDEGLAPYSAVIFLSTTGNVLDDAQQIAFQRFVQGGGGYVGVHAASDTEYEWPWYGQLVGGYFVNHPAIQEAKLIVEDTNDASTAHLPQTWMHSDEWYNHRMVRDELQVLVSIDKTSYNVGDDTSEGTTHPVSWKQEFDGGRSFYTNMGHRAETWVDANFLKHLLEGIRWAMEGGPKSTQTPKESQFSQQVLIDNLREPMELAPLPDGRVLMVERHGSVHLIDPATSKNTIAAEIPVYSEKEDGLLGIALDPGFSSNAWIYLYYSVPGDTAEQHLSRFTFDGTTIDLASEIVLLRVPTQRVECCHAGGSIAFDSKGNLYVSTGDNINPFASDGYSPSDESPGRSPWDAQGTSANSRDYRGKILRIKPLDDGTYRVPEGNLFADGVDGHPEIFVMGNRNPFRISVDPATDWLYWGEIGPDATDPKEGRGPAGHDEINQARAAGFYGWPYFIGNNKAYTNYDFVKKQSGDLYDVMAPINDSPNNSGTQTLPPAQSAWIWYPYGESKEFPLLKTGGRSAMAGPVYHPVSPESGFPGYYEGKLFVHEWMRHKLFVVTMDSEGNYEYMESFMPSTTLSRPMDMAFGPDGSLFLLEYGEAWNSRNQDARLSKITFTR
ncbi:MAG: ThuA domain-containing protein [Bacteroidetes bacterium]|nr:ThuA domain-containing protein [Bacteroidota bacterium]